MIGRVELIVEKVASCEKLFEKLKTNFGRVSKKLQKGRQASACFDATAFKLQLIDAVQRD